MSSATRARVMAAAQQLHYQPDRAMRACARNRSYAIGLLYGAQAPLTTGVYCGMGDEVAAVLDERGYRLLYLPVPDGNLRRALAHTRIDGALVVEPVPVGIDDLLVPMGLPAVLINQECALKLPQISADEAMGAQLLVDHLVTLGHRRIAYVAHPRFGYHHSETARLEAVRAAMGHHHLPLEEVIESRERIAAKWSREDRAPTAVIAYNHADAISLLTTFRSAGRNVPDWISMVCFDAVYETRIVEPPLTTVRVPVPAMGAAAARMLIDFIEDDVAPVAHLRLPEELVLGRSTAAPRASSLPRTHAP